MWHYLLCNIPTLFETYVDRPIRMKQQYDDARFRLLYNCSSKTSVKYISEMTKLCPSGSMPDSSIMLAYDSRLFEKVVVKVANVKNHDTNLLIADNEIKIMSEISHENVVAIIDSFYLGDEVWIEMEYCSRGSLYNFLKRGRITMNEKQIASIVKEILNGLHYLHSDMVIVHNDLKSDNILVTDLYEIKLADFGLSKKLQNRNQKRTIEIGTRLYMAPEIVSENPSYGIEVDIWSLGIIVYELANGKPPHHGLSKEQVIKSIRECPAPVLDADKWSPELCDFVSKTLVKDPTERYSTDQLLQHPFLIQNAVLDASDVLRSLGL